MPARAGAIYLRGAARPRRGDARLRRRPAHYVIGCTDERRRMTD